MKVEASADLTRALSNLEVVTGRRFEVPPADPLAPPTIDVRNLTDAPAVRIARAEVLYHGRQREKWEREAAGAVSLMFIGGADELGGARLGGGLAYTLPAFHAFQGERARAEAERSRALLQERLVRDRVEVRLAGIGRERAEVAQAISHIVSVAEPAARAAVDAANDMRRLGKGEFLAVLTSRRDLALLRLRHLDLIERQWELTSREAAITGRTQ
jgi:outer membrane protein TolC